jgi:hypothetical protein
MKRLPTANHASEAILMILCNLRGHINLFHRCLRSSTRLSPKGRSGQLLFMSAPVVNTSSFPPRCYKVEDYQQQPNFLAFLAFLASGTDNLRQLLFVISLGIAFTVEVFVGRLCWRWTDSRAGQPRNWVLTCKVCYVCTFMFSCIALVGAVYNKENSKDVLLSSLNKNCTVK